MSAPVFLMTFFSPDGAAFNLASRAYMQTVWREHATRSEELTLFGLWVRFSMLRGHPFFERTWMAVIRAAIPDGLLSRNGITTYESLERMVRDPRFQQRMVEASNDEQKRFKDMIDGITRGEGATAVGGDVPYLLRLTGLDAAASRTRMVIPPDIAALSVADASKKEERLKLAVDVLMDRRRNLAPAGEVDQAAQPSVEGEE
jgi:hypothetical protein